jgi:hypothetical protein
MDIAERLGKCGSFACIFELVKDSVEAAMDRRREGLMLALQYLPEQIGAYYGVGANFIVMNKSLLQRVAAAYRRKDLNSYVFCLLLHEYLHSLGFMNERLVEELSYRICRATFGESHLATRMTKEGIGKFIPVFRTGAKAEPEGIEVLDSFDSERISYIG